MNIKILIISIKKLTLFWLLLYSFLIFGQNEKESVGDKFENLKDFFTVYPNKTKVEKDSTLYLSKLINAPIIGYAPETSMSLGIGAKYLFKFNGSGDETRTSNMPATLNYTFNNQFILYSGFEVFTNQEKWVIFGNALFQNFPRKYYGIGRDTPESNKALYDHYQVLFAPVVMKKVFARYLFLGGGVRFNHIFNVESEIEDSVTGFNGSTSTGVQLSALYDSRDNILNASSGIYFAFSHGFYGEFLGGTQNFQLTRFDFRYFKSLSKNARNILGFQFVGHFAKDNVPLAELGYLGSGEIMRGYVKGRYIDKKFLASQVEFRKQFKNSRIGIVTFAGIGDVAEKFSEFKFNNLRPNFGAGFRFMIDTTENLNIRFDWGIGHNTDNVYLNLAEAF